MNVACPPIAAFNAYLGNAKESWPKYDATELAKSYDGPKLPPILIDQVICLTVVELNDVALQRPTRCVTATHERAATPPNFAHNISPASACQQGSSDNFLEKDLTPDRLVAAAKSNSKLEVNLRMQQVQLSKLHEEQTFPAKRRRRCGLNQPYLKVGVPTAGLRSFVLLRQLLRRRSPGPPCPVPEGIGGTAGSGRTDITCSHSTL